MVQNIYFDARWMGNHGIGRFAREILKRQKGFEPVSGKISPTHPFDVIYTTFRVLINWHGIWFSPGYNAPVLGLSRYILTVHDLNHIDSDAGSNLAKRLYYHWVLRNACKRAAKVLTVSEFSRQRIIEWAAVPSRQVVNVGNGVDAAFSRQGERYSPGFRYLLCVSNRKPHKNEVRLIMAFSQADIPSDICLLLTGCETAELACLIESNQLRERVTFAGAVPESDIPAYYRGALGFVFPSLYEGFGLPVLEAMACGVPVLTSNVSSLPEIAGNAALLVDPYSVPEIAEGIERLCHDDALRVGLIKRGLQQAARFQWDDVTAKIQSVLKELKYGRH